MNMNEYDINWDTMDSADFEEMWQEQRDDEHITQGRIDYSGFFREDSFNAVNEY